MKIFRWKKIGGDASYRASSGLLSGPRAFPCHSHDFPEVFWITKGSGVHVVNGEEQRLKPGTLAMIRPSDVHFFRSDDAGFQICNIAISPKIWRNIKTRHFLHDDTYWNDAEAEIPMLHEIALEKLPELDAAFSDLSSGLGDSFQAERFLLNLMHLIRTNSQLGPSDRTPGDVLPDWLAEALQRWCSNAHYLVEGTPALVRLAGRSAEHVSRVLRNSSGHTPTEWLNQNRMKYAATQLAVTNRKVLDISMDCGFASLGHFYAVFQEAHGCAPRAYRMRFLPRPI